MSETDGPTSNVFISYSRRDLAFVNRLCNGLEANNLAPKVDRDEIYSFEDWWQRIETLITEADTVIFALSPDAIASAVCRREVEFAQSLRKRFAPIVCRPVADRIEQVPPALADLNFIYFDDPDAFEPALARLVEALSTDIGWVRRHTQLTAEAREWAKAGKPKGLLLRSPRLETAERWIVDRPASAPVPTDDTRTFLVSSRTTKTRQRNILNGSLFFGIVVALGLAIFSYWQRNVALEQRNQSLIAQSYFLIDQSARDIAAANVPGAIGLALAALPEDMAKPDRPYLPEAEAALNAALQALKERFLLSGHQAEIVSLDFSADGRRLVSASRDGRIFVWDTETGVRIAAFDHGSDTRNAAFDRSADLVVASSSGKASIYRVPSGQIVATLVAQSVETARFLESGRLLVQSRDAVRIWAPDARSESRPPLVLPGEFLAETADSERLATVTADPERVRVWDAKAGRQLADFAGHTAEVTAAALSRGGTFIVTCALDRTARVWNVGDPRAKPVVIDAGERVTGCGIHPDGSQVAVVTGSGNGHVYAADTGTKLADLASSALPNGIVSYLGDGRQILVRPAVMRGLNNIQPDRTASLWDAETGLLVSDFHGDARADASGTSFLAASTQPAFPGLRLYQGDPPELAGILGPSPGRNPSAMSLDGMRFAAVLGNEVMVSARNGPGFLADLAVVPRGARFDLAGHRVVVWDKNDGLHLWAFERAATCVMTGHLARVNGATFSPDGLRMVSVSQDATARLWSVGGDCRLLQTMTGHSRDVRDGIFAPDGRTIVTGSADGTVRFWDGANGAERLPASPNLGQPVDRLAFEKSGAFVGARLKDGTTRVLDVATHGLADAIARDRLLPEMDAALADPPSLRRNSADGRVSLDLASTPTLSDLRTGSIIARFPGPLRDPDRAPFDAAFDADGSRLLLIYPDLVRVVRVPTGTQALIDFARDAVPRCLTSEERSQAHLPPSAPRWCASKSTDAAARRP